MWERSGCRRQAAQGAGLVGLWEGAEGCDESGRGEGVGIGGGEGGG